MDNEEKKNNGFFQGVSGGFSMRRILAFIFALSGIAGGILTIVFKLSWQHVAAAFGVPALASVILLFFTTWTDIASVIEKVKK